MHSHLYAWGDVYTGVAVHSHLYAWGDVYTRVAVHSHLYAWGDVYTRVAVHSHLYAWGDVYTQVAVHSHLYAWGDVLFGYFYYLCSNEKSLLSELLSREEGRFPDLEKQLTFYGNSFDKVKAKEEGVIVPNHGVNRGYDSAQEVVSSVLKELESYLAQQKQRLKCKVSRVCSCCEAVLETTVACTCRA